MDIHKNNKSFEMWRRRLDKTHSGAPKHSAVLKILKMYCSPKQADFLSRMPAKPYSLTQLSKLYKMDIEAARDMLESLIDKFLVADINFRDSVLMAD